jgi:hypothetical protein
MFGRVASANAIASLDEETPEQKAARYKAGSRTHLQIGGIFLTTFFADAWASEGATLMHLTVWCWALHTLYFLIPVNSCRPVSRLLHGPSYVIAHALAAMWLWSLYAARGAELEMAPDGRPEWITLVRAGWMTCAPLVYLNWDLIQMRDSGITQLYTGMEGDWMFNAWICLAPFGCGQVWTWATSFQAGQMYNVDILVSDETYLLVANVVGGSAGLLAYLYLRAKVFGQQKVE